MRGGARAQRRTALCARAAWAALLCGGRCGLSGLLASVSERDDAPVSEIARPHGAPVVAGDTAAVTRAR